MKKYAWIYYFYTRWPLELLRIIIFVSLLALMILTLTQNIVPRFEFVLFSLFMMHEVFFHYHIQRFVSKLTVIDTPHDMVDACTLFAAESYVVQPTTKELVQRLLTRRQVIFMLQKLGIDRKEISYQDINKEEVLKKASEIVLLLHNAKRITTMDLFAAYLLLTESQTKLLFTHTTKEQELLDVLYWARLTYPHEETPTDLRVHFWGEGLGETLTAGWTYETKKYTKDLVSVVSSQRPLLIGREQEFKYLIEALSKKENNNALIVGQQGVGKDRLIAAFGYESMEGTITHALAHKKLLELEIGPLIAGANGREELEVRMQSVIAELSHAGDIILVIPHFENILGSSSFNLDLSGALYPYLQDAKMPVIATMNPQAYKQFVEGKPMQDIFSLIRLEPPDEHVAVRMLLEKTAEIEQKGTVTITYKAVTTAVTFAQKYLQGTFLPGSAVTLLEDAEAAAKIAKKKLITADDVTAIIEQKTHIAVAAPKQDEKELLLHLEEKLHERVIAQEGAIHAVSQAMRRVRSGLTTSTKPVSFLFLGPTGVGKTETAKALASFYFGGENHMLRFDMSEYATPEGVKRLLGAAPGEGEERGELTDKVYDHPFCLILLDEFEKADRQIKELFLQVLDDGRLTENKGRTVSFANAIIIATSNAGAEFIRESIEKETVVDKQFQQQLLTLLEREGIFSPELLNRFDDIVTFTPLAQNDVEQVVALMLKGVTETLQRQDITLLYGSDVLTTIAKQGFDKQFGARPLRRFIQNTIEDAISKQLLANTLKRGDTVVVAVSPQNSLDIHKQ